MSKSHQLSSKIFGAPLEAFSPGTLSKKDIFRVYLWHASGRPVSKTQRFDFIKSVAISMLQHWDVPEDPEIVYKKHLKYTKSIVTKIVNRGTYLQHCGGRENDQAFIDEEQKWFSESVSLKKDSKEVTVEVSFELVKLLSRP